MTPIKSTNVRTVALRSSLALLGGIAPTAAATLTSRLFLRTPARPGRGVTGGVMASAERFELRFEGLRLAGYDWQGTAPAVLLVHGWGGRASQMRHFVEPLRARGHRVVSFDAPGHGESQGSELSLPTFARALQCLAREVGALHAIIAHSFGAAASAVALAEGLSAERAVFLGPPSNELRWFERFGEYLGLSAAAREAAKAAIERRVGAPFSRFSAESLGPAVTLPLLVLHDRLDREVPYEDGVRIASATPGAVLQTTQGLGHRRILRDARVIGSVMSFLAGWKPESELSTGCGRCGAPLSETWGAHSELCMNCELNAELIDRALRWDASAI
jgi:pimeloyl-ACP methyl ester carboxylesterase